LKVLVVHSRYRSGDLSGENRVVADEVELLAGAGHDVRLVTIDPDVDTLAGQVRSALAASWSRSSLHAIRETVRAERPEVIHFHNLFPAVSPAAIRLARSEGATVVLTLHNYRLLCLPATFLRAGIVCQQCAGRSLARGVIGRCYRGSLGASAALAAAIELHRFLGTFDRVSRYIAVSEFVRARHIEAGFSADRISVKPNFAWSTAQRVGPGQGFVYVGRLSYEKGVDAVLPWWGEVPETLTIVGEGPEEEALRATAPPNVRFVGAVAPGAVADFIRESRAVLVPSRSFEGSPRIIAEAYAAGVPVVAAEIGSIPEFVVESRSGFVADLSSVGAWIEAVTALCDNDVSARLGAGAAAEWARRFSPGASLASLEEVYVRALSDAARANAAASTS
jgi:glycosyltransferase involved in cell wall biosynthesis